MQQDLCLSVADACIQLQVLSCDQRSGGTAVRQTSACKDLNLFVMCSQVEYECSLHLLFALWLSLFMLKTMTNIHACMLSSTLSFVQLVRALVTTEACPIGALPFALPWGKLPCNADIANNFCIQILDDSPAPWSAA